MTPDALARALTGPANHLRLEDAPAMIALGLAAAIRAQLTDAHPLRAALDRPRLALLARHMRVRADVTFLLRAWNAAGITPVLLKGFAHALFTHADPAARPYGDVDLWLPAPHAPRALLVARHHGWTDDGLIDARPVDARGRSRVQPQRARAPRRAPLHHRIRYGPRRPRPARHAGNDSRRARRGPGDARARVLTPVDAALLVALTRCWSADAGQPKPADYLDLRALHERFSVQPEQVARRAAALGAAHTWAAFLKRVNPWAGTLTLDEPHARADNDAALRRDGLNARAAQRRYRWRTLPVAAHDVLMATPDILWAHRAVRAGGDVRAAPQRLTLRSSRGPQFAQVVSAVRGVTWVTRLLYPHASERGVCLPRSLALYHALLRRGLHATFVSGVRRAADGIAGHAWVEWPRELRDFEEPRVRDAYRVTFKVSPER
ncbi:lasso peptide biosynthesis B2 protein [Deinococcus maricopensis]|uniref:Microcin J25-processing protein McjB C-terminal domain-containing protein n=1 Tax=Deinococcus maricopensis (strain DSM 21211 / LMG 22137 / NRRL B-23946 / LB-34) TaxID=709986 RepID=E8U985_DEIML|nr:lasso peptide biosynthesis B2 protein [Deinococcus maricopensis]ADV67624.1 hypothetical protein Deima_1979 [Deinococcus maricopensis DSM 21211]